jgi:hypothetical protein
MKSLLDKLTIFNKISEYMIMKRITVSALNQNFMNEIWNTFGFSMTIEQ